MALNGLFSKASDKTKKIWEFVKTFGDWILLVYAALLTFTHPSHTYLTSTKCRAGEVIAQYVGDRKPFEQVFSVLDATISYPKAEHEKVPSYMLYVYCFGVPAAVVLITTLVFGPGHLKRRVGLLNWGLLGVGT
jgi:hypothetical protein